MKTAVIDLGTNTFHLLIVENQNTVFSTSVAAKIGQGGINSNLILPEAQQRAVEILKTFSEKINEFGVSPDQVFAFGTSAIRNADNKAIFLATILAETGIKIKIIDGLEEAKLIYLGVQKAVPILENSLIVDIGGGSVECIIGNKDKILWLHSFELGGQRLMEKFMKNDPIRPSEISRMNDYFQTSLMALTNAVHQYHPKVLIGSSGSFDTLNDIYYQKTTANNPPKSQAGFDYPIEEFWQTFENLVLANREQRLAIPGMIPLRVDMIVVAVCLIKFLIQNLHIEKLKISNYALKEGVLVHLDLSHAQ
jgi:exopolyphosphatase / guanosine-5'-triphosphate,3'-diphosphate pyrophosphatase